MSFEALMHTVERIAANRKPQAIAGKFFSCCMSIVVFGVLRGYPMMWIGLAVVVATGVSLIALGLRYLESRCPEPASQRPTLPTR
jgi:hypothetical protein